MANFWDEAETAWDNGKKSAQDFNTRVTEGVANSARDMQANPLRAAAAIVSGGASEGFVALGEVGKRVLARMNGGDAPALETPGAVPKIDDAAVKSAAAAEEERNKKGRASNLLSTPKSLLGSSGTPNLARQTLLGS